MRYQIVGRLSNFFTEDAIIADRDKFFLLKYTTLKNIRFVRKNIGLDHLVAHLDMPMKIYLKIFLKIKDTKTRKRF
jgi:hypothetical protein